eukprot:TRINITY_DN4419_c0_g1_i3.p1 TRINITY_DN4419_c0_g1~~TRINITY_DN4419_c0_g1_i3.p1  ORF type:complete len:707 (+),score=101.65 TRINITY_DN4419_c0_g1_i3:1-2121(+)
MGVGNNVINIHFGRYAAAVRRTFYITLNYYVIQIQTANFSIMSKEFWNSAAILYLERTLAFTGALTVAAIALGGVLIYRGRKKSIIKLPERFVLEVDLESFPIREVEPPFNLPGAVFGDGPKAGTSLYSFVNGMERASKDDRVAGLLCYIGSNSLPSMASAQEVRDSLAQFRATKGSAVPSCVHTYTLGSMGGATDIISYYVAPAFQKVYMQGSGQVITLGFGVISPFFRRFLDKWKIEPLIFSREEYKSAASGLTQEKFSDPDRDQISNLLGSFTKQVIEGIGQSRGMNLEKAQQFIDNAPHSGDEAIVRGFLDGLKYRSEVIEEICGKEEPITDDTKKKSKKQDSKVLKRVSLSTYLKVLKREDAKKGLKATTKATFMDLLRGGDTKQGVQEEEDKKMMIQCKLPVVALITASGPINARSSKSPAGSAISGTRMEKVLRRLRKDPAVKAVVLRVDSPGGLATASDTIYAEVKNLVNAGKPVVVSMGGVAASGGYYISAPASKIVAQPGTITGSIGVVFGKINARAAVEEQEISVDEILHGKNAVALSALTGFNEEQTQIVNKLLDEIYHDFLQKVASGRGMSIEQVRELAKGRIWTGEDAVNNGLVDELGGLSRSIELAKELANLPPEFEKSMVVPYPPPSPLQELVRSLGGAGAEAKMTAWLTQNVLPVEIGPAITLMDILRQGPVVYSINADVLQGSLNRCQ